MEVGRDQLPSPEAVTEAVRPLTSAELLDVVAEERDELSWPRSARRDTPGASAL
jgi:hypothetical protein